MGDVFLGNTAFEKGIANLVTSCHVRETDSKERSAVIGKMEFLKARANLKGYDLTAVVCSTLKYEDGTSVYADTTEEDKK